MNLAKLALGLGTALFIFTKLHAESTNRITKETVAEAQKVIGLDFNDQKLEMLLEGLNSRLDTYEGLRQVEIPEGTFPAVLFNPLPVGFKMPIERREPQWSSPLKN